MLPTLVMQSIPLSRYSKRYPKLQTIECESKVQFVETKQEQTSGPQEDNLLLRCFLGAIPKCTRAVFTFLSDDLDIRTRKRHLALSTGTRTV